MGLRPTPLHENRGLARRFSEQSPDSDAGLPQEPLPQQLYAQLARPDAALRQYQTCVDALHRDLGVEPKEETRQLSHDILRVRPATR